MYYQERINYIDGILECKTSPNGNWMPCTGVKADIVKLFLSVSRETRETIYVDLKEIIQVTK